MVKKLYYALVGHRSRYTYWAHSKFVKNIRRRLGVEVAPDAASARGWREFNQRMKGSFKHWLTDDLVDHIQDIVLFPSDVYRNIRIRLKKRFVERNWCMDTKLGRWEYHEIDTRVIHGLFETLVDFVEHEKANMQYISESWKDGEQVKVDRVFPSREKGLEYLDWEAGLDEESPHQAETAREVKELYLWWKDVRPNRPDPMDASGWSTYCEERRNECDDEDDFWCQFDHEDETEEEAAHASEMIDKLHQIEEQQYQEDTDMAIRLIKIRRSMWT